MSVEITLLDSVSEETAAEARRLFNAGRSLRNLPLPAWAPAHAKWGVRRNYAEPTDGADSIVLLVAWWHDGIKQRNPVAQWQKTPLGGKGGRYISRNPSADLQRALLVYVSAHPGAKLLEIADALDLKSKFAARTLVEKMIKAGALQRDERGVLRATVLYLEIGASE